MSGNDTFPRDHMKPTPNFTILVIDDEKILSWALSQALTDVGHDVQTACTLKEGIEKLESKIWDVLVTDISLAGADEGLEILAWVHKTCPRTQVIITTAQSDFEVAKKAIEYHAYAFVNKPYEISKILEIIDGMSLRANLYEEVDRLRKENQSLAEKAKEHDEISGFFKKSRGQDEKRGDAFPFTIFYDKTNAKSQIDTMTGGKGELYYAMALEQESARLKTRLELWFIDRLLASPLGTYNHAGEIVAAVNKIACEEKIDPIRMFVLLWNARKESLEYSSAGWPGAYHWDGRVWNPLSLTGGFVGLSPQFAFADRFIPRSKTCSVLLMSHSEQEMKRDEPPETISERYKDSGINRGMILIYTPQKEASWKTTFHFTDTGLEIEQLREKIREFCHRELKSFEEADCFSVYALMLEVYVYILENSRVCDSHAEFMIYKQPERLVAMWRCDARHVAIEKSGEGSLERLFQGLTNEYDIKKGKTYIESFQAVWRVDRYVRV